MSDSIAIDPTQSSPAVSKSKRHKKKKKGGEKAKTNGIDQRTNGTGKEGDSDHEEEEIEEPETPVEAEHPQVSTRPDRESRSSAISLNGVHEPNDSIASPLTDVRENSVETPRSPTSIRSRKSTIIKEVHPNSSDTSITDDTRARLDALAREREALRDEVAQLRRSLEEIQGKHEKELGSVREQLEDTQGEKEHAEIQYRNLLGKVNTIKSQLGERLKADAEDLAHARSHIETLEEQNNDLQAQNTSWEAELAKLAEDGEQRSMELSSLRNRMNLSQQNWNKEREDLIQREAYAREEFETAKQAMSDWEVLAMEERSIRENLGDKVTDLEEQVSSNREAYEKAALERDSQSLTVDGLQRALQEIQDARRRELREIVENSHAQVEDLRMQLQEVQATATESKNALESAQKEIERALPFEMEVKEKNLLIGKLRHEAVILNDHLTKALRYLKRGKPDDNIDKQLVTNHFLHFVALERGDPKKFQVLQIIAALLGWTDEQREQAGLSRPGASNPNLRTPISPWHRTPSTPALTTEFFPEGKSRQESLAGLWSDFLEQEAQEGATTSSRSTSISDGLKK
ncbi:hypothetical protein MMC14_000872 [Varicellaria rhodocarpa]|nr:hypothetical protein [Varicellaria rhodocarpa]